MACDTKRNRTLKSVAKVIAAALVPAATFGAAQASAPPDKASAPAPQQPHHTVRARWLADTIGVNTHIAYTDGGYANLTKLVQDLRFLGITNVRDGISAGASGSAPLTSYVGLARAGAKFTFFIEADNDDHLNKRLQLVDVVARAVPGSVIAVEGANEINNWPVKFDGVGKIEGALSEQAALFRDVKADPALSGSAVVYLTGYEPGTPDPVPAGLADFDNQHPYPNFGQAPGFWVSRKQALYTAASPTEPAVYTETGYASSKVSEAVQAKYTLDLLLDAASEGISRTYLYELIDAYPPGSKQGNEGWGLFDYSGQPKPVANAMHELAKVLKDDGQSAAAFQPVSLEYATVGMPADGKSLAMEKSDGTYLVAIWAEPKIWDNKLRSPVAAPIATVELRLQQKFDCVAIWDPLAPSATLAATQTNTVAVRVSDHPVFISLSPRGRGSCAAATTP
jgi:hypothetical protein